MFSGFVPSLLVNPASDGCVRETLTDGLDLIFTDIMGVLIIAERSGPDYSLHKFVFLTIICHRYYQSCVVPAKGLHRPSRSMHFGDVFRDERRDKFRAGPLTRPETHRPRRALDSKTRTTAKTRFSQY